MEANRRRYQYENSGTSYVEGNTVHKRVELASQLTRQGLHAAPDIRREEQQYEIPSPQKHVHRQPRALQGISLASLMVLTIAIIATLYVCVEYLMLQYDVNQMDQTIISLEHDLTTKSNENDAAFEQINTAVDLDYVYHVAVDELGMVYPNNNKVIAYKSGAKDYVRQYEDIPD